MRSHRVPNLSRIRAPPAATSASASRAAPGSTRHHRRLRRPEGVRQAPLGGAPGSVKPSAVAKAQMLAISECIRAHGVIGFPDPTTAPPSSPGATAACSNAGRVLRDPDYDRPPVARGPVGHDRLPPQRSRATRLTPREPAIASAGSARDPRQPVVDDPLGSGHDRAGTLPVRTRSRRISASSAHRRKATEHASGLRVATRREAVGPDASSAASRTQPSRFGWWVGVEAPLGGSTQTSSGPGVPPVPPTVSPVAPNVTAGRRVSCQPRW
jgi:hypothetical protein